jgi:hypothetical protein
MYSQGKLNFLITSLPHGMQQVSASIGHRMQLTVDSCAGAKLGQAWHPLLPTNNCTLARQNGLH